MRWYGTYFRAIPPPAEEAEVFTLLCYSFIDWRLLLASPRLMPLRQWVSRAFSRMRLECTGMVTTEVTWARTISISYNIWTADTSKEGKICSLYFSQLCTQLKIWGSTFEEGKSSHRKGRNSLCYSVAQRLVHREIWSVQEKPEKFSLKKYFLSWAKKAERSHGYVHMCVSMEGMVAQRLEAEEGTANWETWEQGSMARGGEG